MTIEYRIGDCLELMKELPNELIDLVLTDPPFGVGYEYDSETFEDFDKDDYFVWVEKWLPSVFRVLRPGGSFLCFYSPKYHLEMLGAIRGVGFDYQDLIVWDKRCSQAFNGRRPMPMWEPCAWHTKPGAPWVYNSPCQNVLRYMRTTASTGVRHAAERPCALYCKLINTFSHPGQLVFDPFLGSGTTLLACRITGRNGLGFEIDPQYEGVIKQRIAQDIPTIESWAEGGV